MRYYRHRQKASQRAKAIFLRILFVLAAAVLITGLSIFAGNQLLEKVRQAEELLETGGAPSGNAAQRPEETESASSDSVYSTLQVFAAGLNPLSRNSSDSRLDRLRTIAETYDTVSVKVTSENGTLLYTSPALTALLGMPSQETDPQYTGLSEICTAAKKLGLRTSAVLSTSLYRIADSHTAALADSTLAAELHALGFDEVLLTDLVPENTETDNLVPVRQYLETVYENLQNTASAFSLGACLPYTAYLEGENAKQIQLLASSTDFLAIDLSPLPARNSGTEMNLEHVCQTLAGSFRIYNLRAVLNTQNEALLGAQAKVLARLEITNVQFLTEITSEILAQAPDIEEETEDTQTQTETSVPTTNPYATVAPDGDIYEEETIYRGEDSWA